MVYVVFAIIALIVLWLLAGGSSGRRVRVGRTLEDFEARLTPLRQEGSTWMASGKAERERNADGSEEFELRCSGIRTSTGQPSVPADAVLDVVLDEQVIARVPLVGGQIRLDLHSRDGQVVPLVQKGTKIAVCYEGTTLLEGVFRPD